MILKLEDDVFGFGASYEYINSDKISRIRITRKRIRIYLKGYWLYFYVGITEHNMAELKKLDPKITWI